MGSMQGEARNKDLVRMQKSIERLNQHVDVLSEVVLSNRFQVKEGGSSEDFSGISTAFGKRQSSGRSKSPVRKCTTKSSQSPSSANCSEVSVGGCRKSLPGLPPALPGI